MEALKGEEGRPWQLERVVVIIQGALKSFRTDLQLLERWAKVIQEQGLTRNPHPYTWFPQTMCRLHGLDAGYVANRREWTNSLGDQAALWSQSLVTTVNGVRSLVYMTFSSPGFYAPFLLQNVREIEEKCDRAVPASFTDTIHTIWGPEGLPEDGIHHAPPDNAVVHLGSPSDSHFGID